MPLEVELKIKLPNLDPLEQKLQGLGARRIVRLAETNIFLDTPDLSLRHADSGLRVRLERDRDGQQPDQVIITHKGPRLPGLVKRRQETELHVADVDHAVALLGALGYEVTLRFEKHRDRWRLDDCTVELDTLPMLGCYVEIEGASEPVIQGVREKLGLLREPLETAGYASLLAREIEARNLDTRDIRF